MSLADHLKTDTDLNPSNETILNIIRESDKRGVGTSEIVDAVNLGADAVRNRLHGLEAEGRVESETIGSAKDYDFVWYLADNERTKPVNPDIAHLVDSCEQVKYIGRHMNKTAELIGKAGVTVMVLALTAMALEISLGRLDSTSLLIVGAATIFGAASSGVAGGALICVSVIVEMLGEWIVRREARKSK